MSGGARLRTMIRCESVMAYWQQVMEHAEGRTRTALAAGDDAAARRWAHTARSHRYRRDEAAGYYLLARDGNGYQAITVRGWQTCEARIQAPERIHRDTYPGARKRAIRYALTSPQFQRGKRPHKQHTRKGTAA